MSAKAAAIALIDPKSPSNVGAVMRAAGCYSAEHVFYSGERYDRAAKFHTDTKNVSARIALTHIDDIASLKQPSRALVCVDLIEGATPLPQFEHPENAVYIFGPEDGSISQRLVDIADAVVYVPTVGCMNLAASVNVLLYDRLAKMTDQFEGDAQIRRSRDTNNKVSVRSSL
ncbi:MAG: RNA methyltransferase [Pseudomonadales bacterium]